MVLTLVHTLTKLKTIFFDGKNFKIPEKKLSNFQDQEMIKLLL